MYIERFEDNGYLSIGVEVDDKRAIVVGTDGNCLAVMLENKDNINGELPAVFNQEDGTLTFKIGPDTGLALYTAITRLYHSTHPLIGKLTKEAVEQYGKNSSSENQTDEAASAQQESLEPGHGDSPIPTE